VIRIRFDYVKFFKVFGKCAWSARRYTKAVEKGLPEEAVEHSGRRRATDVQEQFAADVLKLPYNEYHPFTPVDTASW
jgi:hypothetical protein